MLGLFDILLQRPPIACSLPLGSIHLLLPALDRRLKCDLVRIERCGSEWPGGITTAVRAGRDVERVAKLLATPLGWTTTTGASAVAFGVNPVQTTAFNPHPHTSDGHSQPIASVMPVNHLNKNPCAGIALAPGSGRRLGAVHHAWIAMVYNGSSHSPLPTHPHAFVMRSKMLSWWVLNSPNPVPFWILSRNKPTQARASGSRADTTSW